MLTDLEELTTRLQALRRPDADTAFVQRYVGTSLPVLGVRVDDLRALIKEFIAAHKPEYADEDWLVWLDSLYDGPTFEHRITAGMTLHALPAVRRTLDLERLRRWIAGLEGWAAIDTTCQNGWTAKEILARWDEWQPFLDGLAGDANISLRRASLVLLNAPLRENPDPRLRDQALTNVDRLKGERGVLITKAVSWSLRTLTKQHAQAVAEYLEHNATTLPPIAVRETRTMLVTGRKNAREA